MVVNKYLLMNSNFAFFMIPLLLLPMLIPPTQVTPPFQPTMKVCYFPKLKRHKTKKFDHN